MIVRVIDARSPARRKIAVTALCVVAGVFAPHLPFFDSNVRGAIACVLYALACAASFLVRDTVEHVVDADLVPGELRTPVRVLANASRLVGASSARTERGIAFAFAHRNRLRTPLVLEVKNDGEARALREALGIGYGGFGMMAWVLAPRSPARWAIARIVGVLCFLAFAASAASQGGHSSFVLVPGLLSIAFGVCLVWQLLGRFGDAIPPHVTMNAQGVSVYDGKPDGRKNVVYRHITGVRIDDGALHLDVSNGSTITVPVNVPEPIVRHLVAQLETAIARARGDAEAPPAPAMQLADLRRGDEAPRDWLARIDAAAVALDQGKYRSAGLDANDLWATLADPDAPADLRAGVARILVRVAPDEANKRIDALLPTIRDPIDRKRVRIAIDDDLDEAAKELLELDRRAKRFAYEPHS